jgi:peroxiredoxin (alkyl hydroperoxide reductase subunit C)
MGILVRRKAPDFVAKAAWGKKIVDNFTLSQFHGTNVVLFFYPLDFTFVCPTELIAFEQSLHAFRARGTQVIGCSVDSAYSHLAWLSTPQRAGGIEGVSYPIVSDLNKTIARDYDVLVPNEGVAFRALFLIDRKGIVCHQLVNDLPFGRSIEEVLRMIDALAFFEEHGEVCPMNWSQGKKGMKATAAGLEEYFAEIPAGQAKR